MHKKVYIWFIADGNRVLVKELSQYRTIIVCIIRCMVSNLSTECNIEVSESKVTLVHKPVAGKECRKINRSRSGLFLKIKFCCPVPVFTNPESLQCIYP